MDLSPLVAATAPIPIHAIAALIAIILGGIQLYLPKGTNGHRALGYIWVGLMVMVSVSSFFIHEIRVIGAFSPIHGLSLFTLASLYFAVRAARRKNIKRHKQLMTLMYGLALLLTGGFTLLPGRIMHQVLFGG